MRVISVRKKHILIILIIFIITIIFLNYDESIPTFKINEDVEEFVKLTFRIRNKTILSQNTTQLESLYNTNSKYGRWAYEHELKKMKYLHIWEEKQGIEFISVKSTPLIKWSKEISTGYKINLLVSTEYKYVYEDEPDRVNSFRIGSYHYLRITEMDEFFKITTEWYNDPFADSLKLNENKTEDIKKFILSKEERDFSNLNKRRIKAIEYADKYVGAADDGNNKYKYNPKYKDYNPQGGDCANFASQILHEGGQFRKNYSWNYSKDGSKSWVNAQAFKNYIVYSGRGSVIAYGSYDKVYKLSYKLLPGDFVAYEKKGKVTHISVVTGADSKGYSLVNCHNTDRYRVPWDLGWSDKGIKFWLVRVHY